jgi:hypothetical protein
VPFSVWTTSPAGFLDFIGPDSGYRAAAHNAAAVTPASA